MSVIKSVSELMSKPFPEEENIFGLIKVISIISVFVTFFLYVFQPFGISTLESNKFLFCLGFGSMTFLGALFYEFTIGLLLSYAGFHKRWTFIKWILNNLGIMLFIALFNFLFIRWSFFGFVEWALFPTMLYSTLMIGVIPLVAYGSFTLIKEESKYQNIAGEINQKNPQAINTQGETYICNIPVGQIKYIEALQNYIKIGFVNGAGKLNEQIERATMKQVDDESGSASIVRCHRSYMVNQDAIISVKGNAQGLLLSLSDCEKVIPVSRSYVPKFR